MKTSIVSHDYDEALLIIANGKTGKTMLLPEKRHLVALYKRIYELEEILAFGESRATTLAAIKSLGAK